MGGGGLTPKISLAMPHLTTMDDTIDRYYYETLQ